MFDFVFGGKKKLNLIKELLEQRMRVSGFDDLEYRLKVKNMSNIQLIGTPEGTIVTIVDTVLRLQKSGVLLYEVLSKIENHRARIGSDPKEFGEIFRLAKSVRSEDAGAAVPAYCIYRVYLEHPNVISENQVLSAIFQATNALTGFQVYSPGAINEFSDLLDEENSHQHKNSQSTAIASLQEADRKHKEAEDQKRQVELDRKHKEAEDQKRQVELDRKLKEINKPKSSIGPFIIKIGSIAVIFIWLIDILTQPEVPSSMSTGAINLQDQDSINSASLPVVVPALDLALNPLLDEWVSNNPWFGTDEVMTDVALAIHDRLLQEGFDPDSSEYFERIDADMREMFPSRFQGSEIAISNSIAKTKTEGIVLPQSYDVLRNQVKELDWNSWAQDVLMLEGAGDILANVMQIEAIPTPPSIRPQPLYTLSDTSILTMESLQRWFVANQSLYLMVHNVSLVPVVGVDLGHSFESCENYDGGQRAFRVTFNEPVDPHRTVLYKGPLLFYSVFADDDPDCLVIERAYATH